jgi:hypothetical protein
MTLLTLCSTAVIVLALIGALIYGLHHRDPLTCGTVVTKQYIPGYMTMIWSGKIAVPTWIPECYQVTIQGLTSRTKTLTHENVCLPASQYDSLTIGETLRIE